MSLSNPKKSKILTSRYFFVWDDYNEGGYAVLSNQNVWAIEVLGFIMLSHFWNDIKKFIGFDKGDKIPVRNIRKKTLIVELLKFTYNKTQIFHLQSTYLIIQVLIKLILCCDGTYFCSVVYWYQQHSVTSNQNFVKLRTFSRNKIVYIIS